MENACANEIVLDTPSRLLIADAPGLSRMLIRRLLEKRGYQVADADDTAATLEAVELWAPDLLLLNLHLPRMGGVAVLRELRLQYDPARLPIIILASENDAEVAAHCYATGANDYVLKPIQWGALHTRLAVQLSRHTAHVELSGATGQFFDLQT